jgi:methyl-accepting chemotaxis protein
LEPAPHPEGWRATKQRKQQPQDKARNEVGGRNPEACRVSRQDQNPVVFDVPRRFLLAGLAIGGFTLLLGLVLSRSIGRPLEDLTVATRAVAAGDLNV